MFIQAVRPFSLHGGLRLEPGDIRNIDNQKALRLIDAGDAIAFSAPAGNSRVDGNTIEIGRWTGDASSLLLEAWNDGIAMGAFALKVTHPVEIGSTVVLALADQVPAIVSSTANILVAAGGGLDFTVDPAAGYDGLDEYLRIEHMVLEAGGMCDFAIRVRSSNDDVANISPSVKVYNTRAVAGAYNKYFRRGVILQNVSYSSCQKTHYQGGPFVGGGVNDQPDGIAVEVRQVGNANPVDVDVSGTYAIDAEAAVVVAGRVEGVRINDYTLVNGRDGVVADAWQAPNPASVTTTVSSGTTVEVTDLAEILTLSSSATTVSGAVSAGATTMTVADGSQIANNLIMMRIVLDDASVFWARVTAGGGTTSLTFTPAVPSGRSIANGTTVNWLQSNAVGVQLDALDVLGLKNYHATLIYGVDETASTITLANAIPSAATAGNGIKILTKEPSIWINDSHSNTSRRGIFIRGFIQFQIDNNLLYRFSGRTESGFKAIDIANPAFPSSTTTDAVSITNNKIHNVNSDTAATAIGLTNIENTLVQGNQVLGLYDVIIDNGAGANNTRFWDNINHRNYGNINITGTIDVQRYNRSLSRTATNTDTKTVIALNSSPSRVMGMHGHVLANKDSGAGVDYFHFVAALKNTGAGASLEKFVVDGTAPGGAYTWDTGQTFNITTSTNTVSMELAGTSVTTATAHMTLNFMVRN